MGSLSLLQGIFPTQGSNPGLPHCRRIPYQLSHHGRPRILEWVAYPFSRGSSWPRNWTGVFCIAGGFFTSWATREAANNPIPLVKVKVTQSSEQLCHPMDCSLPGASCHGVLQARIGVGSHFLLQRIFSTQGLNQGLPPCRKILYHLSHQASQLAAPLTTTGKSENPLN